MLILFLFSQAVFATDNLDHTIEKGLIFSPTSKDILIQSGTWCHVFSIKIPELNDILPMAEFNFTFIPHQITSTFVKNDLVYLTGMVKSLNEKFQIEYNAFISSMNLMFPEENIQSKKKRSIIDASGLFKSLFNVPSSGDLKEIKKLLSQFQTENQESMVKLKINTGKMLSHIRVNNILIEKLANSSNEIIHKFNNITHKILSFSGELNHISSRSLLLAQFSLSYEQAENVLRQLRHRLSNLVKHQISSELIPPELVISVFRTIKKRLFKLNTLYTIDVSLSRFYTTTEIQVQRIGKQVLIFSQLSMLYAEPEDYNSFYIQGNVLPLNYKEKLGSKLQWATRLVLNDEAIFITLPKQSSYAILTYKQLALCQVTQTRIICNFPLTMTDFSFPDCISAIFTNNSNYIYSTCKYEFLMAPIKPTLTYLSKNRILSTNVSLVKLECADKTSTVQVKTKKSAIINIQGCACLIRDTLNSQLLPAFIKCREDTDQYTTVLNNQFLPQLIDQQQFKPISYAQSSNLLFSMPKILDLQDNDILESTQEQRYSLNQLINANRNSKILYKSSADKALHQAILRDYSSWWDKLKDPLVFTLLAFIIGFQIFQASRLYRMYVILSTIQKVKADYDYYSYDSPEETTMYNTFNIVQAHTKNYNVLIITCLNSYFLILQDCSIL